MATTAPVTIVNHNISATVDQVTGVVSATVVRQQTTVSAPVGIGSKGIPGPKGEDGHSPVLSMIGDQVSIDGVITGPHLTGPQGPQGPQGAQGPGGVDGAAGPAGVTGADGADGANGADGHSPVLTWSGDQIAVDGVVSGPHLTGPQGLQGVQGIQGVQGPVGATGPAGADGAAAGQQSFIQQTRPVEPGPWQWWVTDGNGRVINLILNDGV